MDLSPLHQVSSWEWRLEPEEAIRVPAVPNACVDRSSNKWSKRSVTEHKR